MIPLYKNPNWAKGYDVVVHNECFANTNDKAYVKHHQSAQGRRAGGGDPLRDAHLPPHL